MRFRLDCWLAILPFVFVNGVFAAPPPREPALVAYLSSIDGILDDIDYVVTSGGQPQLSQMVKGFVTNLNNLEGIDRTKPVGVLAFLPVDLKEATRNPDIVGFIPVLNVDDLQKTFHLSNLISLEGTDQPNRYEIKTTEKTLFVLIDQGHAFITEKSELLDLPLIKPETATSVLGAQYDIVVQVRKDGVPKLLWDIALVGALSASDKELRTLKKSTTPEDRLKVRGLEMGRSALVAFMSEVRSAWLGVRVSREDRNAVIEAKLEFSDSGKVMRTLTTMSQSPGQLAQAAGVDAPAAIHLHVALPEDAKKLTAELGTLAREKKDPTESIPEPQRTSVNSLIDVVQQTVNGGEYEVLIQFTGQPQTGMTLVAGVHVADGKKLSEAVTALLPEAKNSDKVSEIDLDAGESRGIHFSRIEGKEDEDHPEESSDAGKVDLFYGGKPSLYVGTDPSTLWLLVGDADALEDFTSLADVPATPVRTEDRVSEGHFGQAHLHLSDWLGLLSLAKDQKTKDFTDAARVAVKDPDRDAVRLSLRPLSDGLLLNLTLDEAYLNLIGAAIGKDE